MHSKTDKKAAIGNSAPLVANGKQAPTNVTILPSEEEEHRPTLGRSHTGVMRRGNRGSGGGSGEGPIGWASNAEPYGRFSVGNDDFRTKGKVDKTSGRLDISVNETSNRGYLAKALGASLHHHLNPTGSRHGSAQPSDQLNETTTEESSLHHPNLIRKASTSLGVPAADEFSTVPMLNIVIMVIGSRGDIQPFLKIGKLLKEDYGHRVRIATHPAFKKFVEEDSGLEFFSVGGDPSELMAFMVKNPGLIPSVSTVKAGEIGRRRDAMFEMFQGFWRACVNATDNETNRSNKIMMEEKKPFVADAIIANPPSFAHVHCAERLGVPLHLMFTFPYSPTQHFPHPLANIKSANVDVNYTNFMSYPLVEMMTWQGLGDLVNRFRMETLALEPVSTLWAPGQLFRLKVPYTYCWSPALIPKPSDWGPEIDIAGFVFLDLASSFKPPEALSNFLGAGEPPVYIGFGSIVVDDPDQFTNLIFEAVAKAGVRALVSKGWGGLGSEENVPDNIYMLENTPHDWLFPKVSAVVHHGGAGTTAIGLKCGKPTMIVPFFGDQPFWGSMVSRAGAGAHEAIPYKHLSIDALAQGIKQCLFPEAKASAEQIAQSIADEGDGAKNAVESFHRHLPLRGEFSMRCTVFPDRVAVWLLKDTRLRLSTLAAQMFIDQKKFRWQDLRLIRHYEWGDFEGPGEPITGGGAALAKTAGGIAKGIGGVPVRWAKSFKKHEKREKNLEQRRPSSANATLPKESEETSSPPSGQTLNDREQAVPAKEGKEQRLHEGPHCAELRLPKANTIGKVASNINDNGNSVNENMIAPVPSNALGSEDDDTVSSADSEDNIVQDLAEDAGVGLAKSGQAIAKAPMDLALAVAQGFHNAPRLYGDTTVRTPIRITGFHSGLRAACEEFTLGVYDGVTGLVLQPYHGAKENGALGFVSGLGKGFGGFVLKDIAAIIGPVGYTLKGVHKEITKNKQPAAFIRRSRMVQAGKDIAALDEDQRRVYKRQVDSAWRVLQQIKNEEDMVRSKGGVIGHIRVKRTKRKLDSQGAFESVGRAKKVVEDRKMNRFIEETRKTNTENEKKAAAQFKQGNKSSKKNRLVKIKGDKINGDEKGKIACSKSLKKQPPQINGNGDQIQQALEDGRGFLDSDETAVQTPSPMPETTTDLQPNENHKTNSQARHEE